MQLEAPGLRDRKAVKIKLKIVELFGLALTIKTFEEIIVDEICEQAMISKVTFFKYFPSKGDVLVYYYTVWLYKLYLHCSLENLNGLGALRYLFTTMGDAFNQAPNLCSSFMSENALLRNKISFMELSDAEKWTINREREIEGIDWKPSLGYFLMKQGKYAIDNYELSVHIKVEELALLMGGLFNGSGTVGMRVDPQAPGNIYFKNFDSMLALLTR